MSISIIGHSVNHLRQKFSQSVGLPIRDALPADAIEAVVRSKGLTYRRCLFDPVVTIWAFLSQILDSDRSCRKALSRVWAYLGESSNQALPFDADAVADTGAYCKARQRLSEAVLNRLYRQVAQPLEADLPPERLWRGRHVYLVDGTTLLLPEPPKIKRLIPNIPTRRKAAVFP